MKAVIVTRYGSPEEVVVVREVEQPALAANQVLIKVHAAAINDYDWALVRGQPMVYRLLFGLFKPKNPIPGMELAGMIERVGANVQRFKVGDEVYGDISQYGFGSFAEFIAINENAVVKKPEEMTFEEATAIPHASLLALQGLRKGGISEGQKILINGGGGGVGTFGLQIAKLYNCEVTGVDTGEKLEMMKSIGFDQVIDYKMQNFTRNGRKYDLILDCKSNKPALSYLRSLTRNGKYITVGGTPMALIRILLAVKPVSWFTSKKLQILSLKSNEGLDYIEALFKQNKIRPVLDGPYLPEEIPELIRYFGDGGHKGKIVIKF